jgi:hypothetical protein
MQNTLSTSRARPDELTETPLRADLPAPSSARAAGPASANHAGSEELHVKKIRDWLLAILRYAVTLDPSDAAAATTMAEGLDGAGTRRGRAGFRFFTTTGSRVCNAIVNRVDPQASSTLEQFLRLIDHPRLRRALEEAIGDETAVPPILKRRRHAELWKGLRRGESNA